MQIVINIDKEDFEEICILARMDENTRTPFGRIKQAIFHGTPLPKGHGRLIDADSLDIPVNIRDGFEAMAYIEGVDTIIEADRSVE